MVEAKKIPDKKELFKDLKNQWHAAHSSTLIPDWFLGNITNFVSIES